MSPDAVAIEPVAVIGSPFGEKFGTPRQPGLAPHAIGEVRLLAPYDDPAMLDGLEGFSHIWLTFRFDRCVAQGWRPRVRPPRLGGNAEVGVWASRAPFRPNFLGLSVVRLLEVVRLPTPLLRVAGLDLIDGTPVFDIKPYVPYADAIADAVGGFAAGPPEAAAEVGFAAQAQRTLRAAGGEGERLAALIREVLAQDPRPAYRRGEPPGRVYGMRLGGHEVRWRVHDDRVEVVEVTAIANDGG